VARKLVLIVVDGLAPDTLATAIASGAAPHLAMLVERGGLGQAVSTFPSLTPVCLSTIATGAGPDRTRIPALQWYHRGEQRFVEYGSSFQATLVEGAKQSVDDAVVNLNHVHLSPKLTTIFEAVEDAGKIAASVNFPVWRGRTRHTFKHSLLGRFARRTGFMDAAYGPSQFYFGELFASERTGAPPSLGVGGRNDANAAAVGRWLVARDGFDFLLFYLPETDSAGHRGGDALRPAAVAGADDAIETLMAAAGGVEPFLERYAVILCADHGQSPIDCDDDIRDAFGDLRLFRARGRTDPAQCDLAVAASNRAGHVYRLASDIPLAEIGDRLLARPAVDVAAWRDDDHAVVRHAGRELRFTAGGTERDSRGNTWTIEGDRAALELEAGDVVSSASYPNALERLWQILHCVNAGDVVASAAPRFEFCDSGGASHLGGGSHGSLHAADSLVPLAAVGLHDAPELPPERSIEDIAALCASQLGIGTW
jgi:Type I phosphodiesterase / nucleotide pyrophosphatase